MVLKAPSLHARPKITEILILLEYSNQCCEKENFIPRYIVKKGWNSVIVKNYSGGREIIFRGRETVFPYLNWIVSECCVYRIWNAKLWVMATHCAAVFVWLLCPVICDSFFFGCSTKSIDRKILRCSSFYQVKSQTESFRDCKLRTFARKFSNIDFFLKILPLKDDELVMSEM